MSRLIAVAALAAALLAVGAPGALAQSATPNAMFAATTVTLSAFGEAEAAPDMATLSLGVETAAPTAAQAMGDNAAAMARVIAAIKAAGVKDRDLKTSSLSLAPQYVYEQNGPARLTGYQASNQVVVTVRDLARLGPLADAAVAAGATNVGQIAFGLADPLATQNSARVAAVKALEDKAALYAQAVGYHIVRLVNLTEGAASSPGPRPFAMTAMRAGAPTPTPVEAGELKMRVDVTGVFELGR
jgi:hypothetical protein